MRTATYRERLEIVDVRENSWAIYHTLNARTAGTLEATITVRWSLKHRVAACLTCKSSTCAHVEFVRMHLHEVRD